MQATSEVKRSADKLKYQNSRKMKFPELPTAWNSYFPELQKMVRWIMSPIARVCQIWSDFTPSVGGVHNHGRHVYNGKLEWGCRATTISPIAGKLHFWGNPQNFTYQRTTKRIPIQGRLLREANAPQNGWIFKKVPNGLWPPPLIFGKSYCNFFSRKSFF